MFSGILKSVGPVLLRYALAAAGAAMVTKGYITPEQAATTTDSLLQIGGTLLTAGAAVWGSVRSTPAAKLVSTASIPGVKVVLPTGRAVETREGAQRAVERGDLDAAYGGSYAHADRDGAG